MNKNKYLILSRINKNHDQNQDLDQDLGKRNIIIKDNNINYNSKYHNKKSFHKMNKFWKLWDLVHLKHQKIKIIQIVPEKELEKILKFVDNIDNIWIEEEILIEI